MAKPHILYAMTHSLYSGRARSYLIKHQIPFQELSTGHESFKAEVLPKGKLPTIPTLVTPEGEVIRYGAAIIEHFEAALGRPSRPTGPKQRIISALFDVIGTDGLLRPAMHYRWNFPEDNLAFVRYHLLHSQRDTPERSEKTEAMMNRMRHAAMIFGVTEQSQGAVESLYLDYLEALNAHLEHYPYLLGWRPSIGDFGLSAPMYAPLGQENTYQMPRGKLREDLASEAADTTSNATQQLDKMKRALSEQDENITKFSRPPPRQDLPAYPQTAPEVGRDPFTCPPQVGAVAANKTLLQNFWTITICPTLLPPSIHPIMAPAALSPTTKSTYVRNVVSAKTTKTPSSKVRKALPFVASSPR